MHEEKKKKEKYIYNNWIYLSVRMKNILWHVKKKKKEYTHNEHVHIWNIIILQYDLLPKKILFSLANRSWSSCWIIVVLD